MSTNTYQALVINEPKGHLKLQNVSKPTLGKGELLIRNLASALNPVDWKQIENNWIAKYPYVLGVDVAGVVEEVGQGVTKFKKGDRVFSYSRLNDDIKYGGHQTHTVVNENFTARFPDNITPLQAASIPLGSITSALALFYDLKIPCSCSKTEQTQNLPSDTILIWGGSCSTGFYGIQLARLAGFKNIIATTSPRNFELVKSLGATQVFDYKDPQVGKKIKEATQGRLKLIYDTVGAGQVLLETLSNEGGSIVTTIKGSLKDIPSNVKFCDTYAGNVYLNPEAGKIGREFYSVIYDWLASGKYKPNEIQQLSKGINGVEEGLELLKNGKVSGKKLVYAHQERTSA